MSGHLTQPADTRPLTKPVRLLITAGPTHEPIDEVRFIANRSSGKVGIEIAAAAENMGWAVTLLLGPTHLEPRSTSAGTTPDAPPFHTHPGPERFRLLRYTTTEDLRSLLRREIGAADVLIMAAAVADYRPKKAAGGALPQKLRRGVGPFMLELEPTPDLLAECAASRAPGADPRLLVGFALEPRDGLLDAAREKLERKGIDLIVANPLETMDADDIEAAVLGRSGLVAQTERKMSKPAFGAWLIGILGAHLGEPAA